jgi:hypothetical protein
MPLGRHAFGDGQEARLEPGVVQLAIDLGGGRVARTSHDRFAPWDYVGLRTFVELKSRTCSSSTYPTAIINRVKVDRGRDLLHQDPDARVIFVFNYTDLVLFCRMEITSHYELRADGFCHIPRRDLTPVPGVQGSGGCQQQLLTDFFIPK